MRPLVVQEGPSLGGWAANVVTAVAGHAFAQLRAPIGCLTGHDRPLPFAPHLEQDLVPSTERIVAAATDVVRGG